MIAIDAIPGAEGDAAVEEPREVLAGRLIDAWCADKGKQIPWAKAVQIVAIVTKQPDEQRDRLLKMDDDDGSCGKCGRSDDDVDAKRYRWLRAAPMRDGHALATVELLDWNENGPTDTWYQAQGKEMDTAIDAARTKP